MIFHCCQVILILQLASSFSNQMLVVKEVSRQLIVHFLPLLKPSAYGPEQVREILLFHLELLVTDESIFIIRLNGLFELLLLHSHELLELLSFDREAVDFFIW